MRKHSSQGSSSFGSRVPRRALLWGLAVLLSLAAIGNVAVAYYKSARREWLTNASTKALVAAAEEHPRDSEVIYTAAFRLWEREGRAADALPLARRAADLDPRNAKAQLLLAYTEAATGRPASALRRYEHAAELQPDLALAHKSAGEIYNAVGMPERAIPHFERAWNRARPDIGARAGLVKALCALDRHQQAEALCREMLPFASPTAVESFRLLHLTCLPQGRGQLAEQALREHMSRHRYILDGSFPAELGRQILKNRTGATASAEAEAFARKAIAKTPDLAAGHEVLGLALERRGEFIAAAQAFRKALSLAPGTRETRTALARCLRRAGDEAGALALEDPAVSAERWRKAMEQLKARPHDPAVRRSAAAALLNAGDPAAAFRAAWPLVETDPSETRGMEIANQALANCLRNVEN